MAYTQPVNSFGNSPTSSVDGDGEATYSSLSIHNDAEEHAVFRSVAVGVGQPISRSQNLHFATNPRVDSSICFVEKGKLANCNWKREDDALACKGVFRNERSELKKPPARLSISSVSMCHVYVMLTLHNLVKVMTNIFNEDENVDHRFDEEKTTWEVTLFSEDSDKTVISVYVYTCPESEGTYLVEFCREMGCAFTGCSFFGRIKSKLTASGIAYDENGDRLKADTASQSTGLGLRSKALGFGSLNEQKSQSEMDFIRSMSESDMYDDFSEDELEVGSLFDLYLQLAGSKSVDTRVEGFKLLVSELAKGGQQAARDCVHVKMPSSSSSISFLLESTQSKICCVRRCALTALAYISTYEENHDAILNAGAVKNLTDLINLEGLIPETKRQIITVLANLCVDIKGKEEVHKRGGRRLFYLYSRSPSSGKKMKAIANEGLDRVASFNELIAVGANSELMESMTNGDLHVPVRHVKGVAELLSTANKGPVAYLLFVSFACDKLRETVETVKSLRDRLGGNSFLTSVLLVATVDTSVKDSQVYEFVKKVEADAEVHFAEYISGPNESFLRQLKQALPGLEGLNDANDPEGEIQRLKNCQTWLEDLRKDMSGDTGTGSKAAMVRIFERLKQIKAAVRTCNPKQQLGLDLD